MVDGNLMNPYLASSGGNPITAAQTFQLSRAYEIVTPNANHTFSFEYQTTAGTGVFFNMCLVVQPL